MFFMISGFLLNLLATNTNSLSYCRIFNAWVDSGFSRGQTIASAEHEPIWVSEGCGIHEQSPWSGSGGLRSLKLKAFLSIFIQKRPVLKVKDLSDSSPPCPQQTASCSHDQPLLLVSGGGHLLRPCLDPGQD